MKVYMSRNGLWENEMVRKLEENRIQVVPDSLNPRIHRNVGVLMVTFEPLPDRRRIEEKLKIEGVPFLSVHFQEENLSYSRIQDWVNKNGIMNLEVRCPVRVKDFNRDFESVVSRLKRIQCFTEISLVKLAA